MSIPILIYFIGAITAAAIAANVWYRLFDDEIKVIDLVLLVLYVGISATFSWVSVVVATIVAYGDKVVYKKRKD